MDEQHPTTDYWSEWQETAVAAGVPPALAELGTEVLRTHRKNRWGSEFLGLVEDGPHMLELCLTEPAQAEMLFTENLYPYNTSLLDATRLRLGLN